MSLKECLSVNQQGEPTMSKYLQQIRTMADNLGPVGSPIVQDDLILYTLNRVGPDYKERPVIPFVFEEGSNCISVKQNLDTSKKC